MKTKTSFDSRTLGWVLCIAVALLALTLSSVANPKKGYVAHEWGTFTSLQAPDGTLLTWNAGAPTDLPGFIYSWSKPGSGRSAAGSLIFNKGRAALQRMETPVVYLYGEGGQKVDVKVQFPKGTITEWYPHAADVGPSSKPVLRADGSETNETNLKSMIRWQTTLLLKEESATAKLPVEKADNHYFAARETDASLLRVAGSTAKASSEVEKLLFYRGIGHFGTPLKVTGEDARITVSNTGTEPLKHLFIYTVQEGNGQFISIDQLAPGEENTVEFSGKSQPLSKLTPQISRQLIARLRKQGLYEAEARAMVKTWQSSWFEEEGTRVLYTLPEKWTEEILPMTLEPRPRELVRVMVGRAELIRHDTEQELVRLLTQARDQEKDVSDRIAGLLKPYGRFGHSIFLRALSKVDPKYERPELVKLYSMNTPVK